MESVKSRQSTVLLISLIQYFFMVEQKFDPQPISWALAFTYIPIILKKFQRISWGQLKLERVEKRQSSVIIKIFLFRFFYMMEQKSRTPT